MKTREELTIALLSQPEMIRHALLGYVLYWCSPHQTFKLYKATDWGLEADVAICQVDGEYATGCNNVHINNMKLENLELATRIMSIEDGN